MVFGCQHLLVQTKVLRPVVLLARNWLACCAVVGPVSGLVLCVGLLRVSRPVAAHIGPRQHVGKSVFGERLFLKESSFSE